jgi:hypothetical protein
MYRTIEYELPDEDRSIICDLDSPGSSFSLGHEPSGEGSPSDEFVLEASPDTLRRFARLFAQLADRGELNAHHVHLGTSSNDAPQGPGWRIVATTTPTFPADEVPEAVESKQPHLREEASRATALLRNQVVARIQRPRAKTILLAFRDGARLYVDHQPDGLEISIEGGNPEAGGGA